MANFKTCNVAFFEAEPRLSTDAWPAGEYPVADVAAQVVAQSRKAGDAKYIDVGGQTLYGAVFQATGVTHLCVYRIRQDGLPSRELNGVVEALKLPRGANLAEPKHIVFFPNNIVGMIAGRDGPGKLRCASYLGRLWPDGVPSITFRSLFDPDVLRRLDETGEAKIARIRMRAGAIDGLTQSSPALRDAMRRIVSLEGIGSVEVLIRPERTIEGQRRFTNMVKRAWRSVRNDEDADPQALRLLVEDEDAAGGTDWIDLLGDELTTTREVELEGSSRYVEPIAAQRAMITAHSELLPTIKNILDQRQVG